MIIDDHNHAYYHGFDCNKMLANMDMYGIDKTWLLTWEGPMLDCDPTTPVYVTRYTKDAAIPLEATLEYIRQAPDRFVLGFAPDPRLPDAMNRLKGVIKGYDVKIVGEVKLRMLYDDPDALRMWRFAGENGMPVLFHFDYPLPNGREYPRPDYWYGGDIDTLERVLKACPETNFIAHAPGFWAHISGDDKYKTESYPQGKVLPGGRIPQLLDKYKNLYCDMSAGSGCNALTRDPEFGRKFLTDYNTRILYGRDMFDNRHQEMLRGYDLPQEVLDNIYFRNALSLIH